MGFLEQKIEVFKEVAEVNNITLASKRLHMSQPSVSIQIHELERELGVTLFSRSNKGVELTQAGQVFNKHANNLIHAFNEMRNELATVSQGKHKTINIGATLTIGEYILPYIVQHYNHIYPDINFNVKVANTKILTNDILERKLDMALVEGPVSPELGLLLTKFWQDKLVLVAPVDHRLAKSKSISYEELVSERLILREKGSGTRAVMELAINRCGQDPKRLNVVAELGSTQAIKNAVADGMGLTIISELAVKTACKMGLLKTLGVDGCDLSRPLNVLRDKNVVLNEEESKFNDFILDTAKLRPVLTMGERQRDVF